MDSSLKGGSSEQFGKEIYGYGNIREMRAAKFQRRTLANSLLMNGLAGCLSAPQMNTAWIEASDCALSIGALWFEASQKTQFRSNGMGE